mgnify:CR=1 FL=1
MTPPTPSETSSVRRCKHKKIVGRGTDDAIRSSPVISAFGSRFGSKKKRKNAASLFRPYTKKVPDFWRNQELFGGDCWTRTSDLLRVKNCVMTGAGGHSRRVPHRHRSFAPPQGLKLYTATAVYSLKKPDT